MKVVVVSDTHGEADNVNLFVARLEKLKPDLVIHLGDDYGDVDSVKARGFKLVRVPGVFEELYRGLDVAHRLILRLADWYALVTHTEKSHENDLPVDLKPEDLVGRRVIDLVLHGHTHVPKVEAEGGIVFVNPGHLKKQDKKGYPPTYAILVFSGTRLRVSVERLDTAEEVMGREFTKELAPTA